MLVHFAVQANTLANMEFEFVFLRFECRDRRILNVFQLSRTIVKKQMNLHMLVRKKKLSKVVKANRTNMLVWFVGQLVVRFLPALKGPFRYLFF